MSNIEIIKDKVRKLLALSKSDNENEAAAALEKANEFISKYNLDEKYIIYKTISVKSSKTYVPWSTAIANAVSWLYGCYKYRDPNNGTFVFIGEEIYVFMAAEMYVYLIKTIERCSKNNIRKNAKLKFRKDFKFGMAIRLYERIMELGAICSWCSLRDINIEQSKDFAERAVELVNPKVKNISLNRTAFSKGIFYGNNVSLARQAGFTPVAQIT